MEVDYTENVPEKDLKVFRSYMNSKIDIFQQTDGNVFRKNKIGGKFYESYEHRLMQNSSSKILSSVSNLLVYSLSKGIDNLEQSQKELKFVFSTNKIGDKNCDAENVENRYCQFNNTIMRKKLQNDLDFKQLCDFIDNSRFHELMVGNNAFLKYILNHKYIKYHDKNEEINEKYRKYLCPMFTSINNSGEALGAEEEN